MFCGFELGSHLAEADAVLVINAGVPWMPRVAKPKASTKVIHMGVDPLVSRHPFREYEADLLVGGDPVAGLVMLREALAGLVKDKKALESRRNKVSAARTEMLDKRDKFAVSVKDQTPIHPAWLGHCLNQVKAKDAVVVNELGVQPGRLDLTTPLSFIGSGLAGGLGAGLGTALGAKLAAPDAEVVAIIGDGGYQMLPGELATIVQEHVKVILVVLQNYGFSSIGALSESRGSQRFATQYRMRNPQTGLLDGDHVPLDIAANAASFGLKVLVRAVLAPRDQTFLDIVCRAAEEEAHLGMDELDLGRTVKRFVGYERRARDLYRRLAAQLQGVPGAARFFLTLAGHEEGHAPVLARVRRELRRGRLWKASREIHVACEDALDGRLRGWEGEVAGGVALPRALEITEALEASELNVVFDTLEGCVDMRSRARFERFFVLTQAHLAFVREGVERLRAALAA
jgi:rubrerythrin